MPRSPLRGRRRRRRIAASLPRRVADLEPVDRHLVARFDVARDRGHARRDGAQSSSSTSPRARLGRSPRRSRGRPQPALVAGRPLDRIHAGVSAGRRGLSIMRTDGTDLHDVAGDLARPVRRRSGHLVAGRSAGSTSLPTTAPRATSSERTSRPDPASSSRAPAWPPMRPPRRPTAVHDRLHRRRRLRLRPLGRSERRDGRPPDPGVRGPWWLVVGRPVILVRWKPQDDALGGLGTIGPDGTQLPILVPFDPGCRHGWDEQCDLGFGWGQARP